jgi:protein-S-isoprenylcysteine O-methyltransferase Ste14
MFFIACDWMASYEEKDLVRVLGDKYVDYQKKVSKWFYAL